ncbi:MAG: transglycosylase domain-containing protein [Lachnospiraceae bacterium]|nr:transglycosylase domain-containing protein [Lachnospiraceae bacterium]
MVYSKREIKKEIRRTESRREKSAVKILLFALKGLVVALVFAAVVGTAFVLGSVRGVIDSSPRLTEDDIEPKGLETTIYDSSGKVIQTLVGSGANRTLVSFSDLPADLVNAFTAIEDERFWNHEGIDLKGILRAAIVGVAGGFNFTEGASTLTQQLIKNNVFNGGAEKTTGARFVRKIQEQSLALQIELDVKKKDIFTYYVNTINLGANCLGVEKAAERYFDKTVSELSLSECAVIAAITQNPYAYNPIRFPEKNQTRRDRVLSKMEAQGYITAEQKQAALNDDVYTRIAEVNYRYQKNDAVYSYFVDRLISQLTKDFKAAGYSDTQTRELLYSGGLHIYSTQDMAIQSVVDEELAKEENYEGVDQKYSFTYSLRVVHEDGTYNDYNESDVRKFMERTYLDFDTKDEITSVVNSFKGEMVKSGDKVTIENLDISLQPQLSVSVIDQSTGYVKALAGGRGEKTSSLSLNRATSTFRQPGSTFKVLASFAPALEYGGATLATTFYDEPYSVGSGNEYWSPKNWYSTSKFAGWANIHQGIVYSMNIVAVKCLVEKVGVGLAYDMVETFGINTLIPQTSENRISGKNDYYPTLALGGITQGVTNLQLTAAYAAIANDGIYKEPILYTKVIDDRGNVLLDKGAKQDSHTVISEQTAYLLTSAMADSMKKSRLNDLFSSSSPAAALENMPAAGKSGTTNSYNDLWFVGFTPYYTAGIWSGFDDNAKFSSDDNRDFHKIIWKHIMDRINADLPAKDFEMPAGIVMAEICTKSGMLATEACKHDLRSSIVTQECFVKGTEPTQACTMHHELDICEVSNLLASPDCQTVKKVVYLEIPEGSNNWTNDSPLNFALAPKETEICTVCTPLPTEPPTEPPADPGTEPGTEPVHNGPENTGSPE